MGGLSVVWGGVDSLLVRTGAPHNPLVRLASAAAALAMAPLVVLRMFSYWSDARESGGAAGGAENFSRRWPHRGGEGNPRGRVFILHGLAEHSGRYEHVAAQWALRGFEVHALDHRGHGRTCRPSPPPDCFFRDYRDLVRDACAWIDAVVSGDKGGGGGGGGGTNKDVPNFLFGHSMGGGLAVHVARAMPGVFRGVCLSAPAIKPDPKVATPVMVAIARALASILPRMPLTKLPLSAISRDASVIQRYLEDPYVYTGGIRSAVALALLGMTEDVMTAAAKDTFPFLLLHGTADALCNIEGSIEYTERSSAEDKTLGRLDGLYHEICNEPEGAGVISKFAAWMEARV